MSKLLKITGLVILLVILIVLALFGKDLLNQLDYTNTGIDFQTIKLEHASSNCKVESVRSMNANMIDGKIYILTIYKTKMNFEVTNKSYADNDFYVNSNFFGMKREPIGEVKINAKAVSGRIRGGGFFYSDGVDAGISIATRPDARFVSQTRYVSLHNYVINNSFDGWGWGKLTTDRLLIGENETGDMMVIHTGFFGSATIKNMNLVAHQFGLKNAIHLDGGPSVQIKLKDGQFVHEYKALSDFGRKFTTHQEPPIHIVGNFN